VNTSARASNGVAEAVKVLSEFAEDEGRSVAVRALRGPQFEFLARSRIARPAASVLKIAIAMTAYDMAAEGRLDLDESIERTELAKSIYPSLLKVFDDDHWFTLHEICGMALALSDNPSADYLLQKVGLGEVTGFLDKIGCSETILGAGYGDAELSLIGRRNISTAEDVLRMLEYLHSSAEQSGVLNAMENGLRKSRIALRLPEDLPVANKSGSLDGVCNDAALIRGEALEIACVVLTDHQSDTALTGVEIGDAISAVWRALGGRVDEINRIG
jgi:beta-lactamase class A